MPIENYQRPKGVLWMDFRCVQKVILPWLNDKRREHELTQDEATFVYLVAARPGILGPHNTIRLIQLLRRAPGEVGEIILLVSEWRVKQSKSKMGRARRAIEEAMTFHPDQPLNCALVCRVAKEAGIDLHDVSPDYIRNRVDDIRREWKDYEGTPPSLTFDKFMAEDDTDKDIAEARRYLEFRGFTIMGDLLALDKPMDFGSPIPYRENEFLGIADDKSPARTRRRASKIKPNNKR